MVSEQQVNQDSGSGPKITQVSDLDFGDPLYLHASDTSITGLISLKLKGTENYNVWSRAMLLALQTKNNIRFIDGTVIKSTTDDVLGLQWDRCNSVVLSWVLNSVSEELFSGQVFSSLTKTVWDELKETYDKIDESITFNLHKTINTISQNGDSLLDYYHKLNSLWKQFDALVKLPSCGCANPEFKKHNDMIKLTQFLMGLDDYYQSVRSNILTRKTLPSVQTAFSIVSKEESHKNSSNVIEKNTQSAFLVSKSFDNNKRFGKGPNPNLKYSKCNRLGHTIDRCNEILGYPPGWVKRTNFTSKNVQNNNSMSSHSDLPFTTDQINKIMSLIGSSSSGRNRNVQANVAGTFHNWNVLFNSKFETFFKANESNIRFNNCNGWIIDSGASQHMTGSIKKMENFFDVTKLGMTVGYPNGTIAKITKIGDLKLNSHIILRNVLVVPGYCVNLLSVHQLSKDKNIFVGFNDSKCYIQDLLEKKIVGTGSINHGLYMFDDSQGDNTTCISSCHASFNLWHHGLGHPVKPVLDLLKNTLNWKDKNEQFVCDTCHKAKQTRDSFSTSDHKSNVLGDLIHLDLWGPYRVTSRDGFRYFLTIVDDFTRAVWVQSPNDEERTNDDEHSGSDHSDHEDLSSDHSDTTMSQDTEIDSPEGNIFENQINNNENNNEEGTEDGPRSFVSSLEKSTEPSSYFEASQQQCWKDAMDDEMEALNRNNTWIISDLPTGRKPIGCKWIYKIKYKSNGEIERYKARLVAKRYSQREGIDYDETFSPVVKMVTVRCVLTLAVQNNWNLFQLDINNAFLYGDLSEEVYMSLPEGYYSDIGSKVCKLTKSLYGLKQAPRQWNEKLSSFLSDYGFIQSINDYSLYTYSKDGIFLILLVYVDDIILAGNNVLQITKVKDFLKSKFKIKDLGDLKYFLGI
ncbi:uncharacterized protein [Rutidosis leptorrhynchoides]|uniref:uncharacterized protein n=1 Tax=Rutidosis leptorrhynchoides TaxID=125765 RepID=UPI003A99302D